MKYVVLNQYNRSSRKTKKKEWRKSERKKEEKKRPKINNNTKSGGRKRISIGNKTKKNTATPKHNINTGKKHTYTHTPWYVTRKIYRNKQKQNNWNYGLYRLSSNNNNFFQKNRIFKKSNIIATKFLIIIFNICNISFKFSFRWLNSTFFR